MKCASVPSAYRNCIFAPRCARPGTFLGAERPVDDRPVGGPPQLRAHDSPALAGLDVLELDDLEDRAVDLDVVAVLELVGGDRHTDGEPRWSRLAVWSVAPRCRAPRVS